MSGQVSRRRLLKTGALGCLAAGSAVSAFAQQKEGKAVGKPLRIGLIGTGSRGTHLLRLLLAQNVEVPALCDIEPAHLNRAVRLVEQARDGATPGGYSQGPYDYRRMLGRDDLDAVVVATPMQWHAVMSVDALRAGKHVLSEVAAAVTLDECWQLVRAVEETGNIYMLSENCCYWEDVMLIGNMVRQGLFGTLTFAECGYVHDCRRLDFKPDGTLTWRGELARDHAGNLYPTHSFGPVARWLGINRGDRMVTLTAAQTRQAAMEHFVAQHFPEGSLARKAKFKVADSTTVLIRTAQGVLIDLRYDTRSARPHPSTTYYSLQGTTASYESRLESIWIEGRSPGRSWEPVEKYRKEFEHPVWKQWRQQAAGSGHRGGDYLVLRAFLDAVASGGPAPIDVYDAVAWSAIIPLSEQSLAAGGKPVEVPDFTGGRWEKAHT